MTTIDETPMVQAMTANDPRIVEMLANGDEIARLTARNAELIADIRGGMATGVGEVEAKTPVGMVLAHPLFSEPCQVCAKTIGSAEQAWCAVKSQSWACLECGWEVRGG